MAVTGGRITGSFYRVNTNDEKFPGAITGRTRNFPNVGTIMYDLPPDVKACGITMNAVVEVLPTGLRQNSVQYYTPATVAQLLSSGT
jgi:hypothetical protein